MERISYKVLFVLCLVLVLSCEKTNEEGNSLAMEPDFTYTAGSSAGQIYFKSLVKNVKEKSVERFEWLFGDGQRGSATADHPIHYYKSNGTYDVTLSTFIGDVKESITRQITVTNVASGGGGSNGGGSNVGGGGTVVPKALGSVVVWTNQKENGFLQGFNHMNVSVMGQSGTIYGGQYTVAPSCGAKYCFTAKLEPGRYNVSGVVYPVKPLVGPTPNPYSVSQTVDIIANQCVSVLLR